MSIIMDETELKKLTVTQLKRMCKEKNITGYSKLGKSCIIEKLVNWQRSPATTGNDNLQLLKLNAVVITDTSSLQPLPTLAQASTSRPASGTTTSSSVSTLPVDPTWNSFGIASTDSSDTLVSVARTQDNYGLKAAIPISKDKEPRQDATLISPQPSKSGQNPSNLANTKKMLHVSRKRPLEEETIRSKKTRTDELQLSASVPTPASNVSGLRERAKLMLPPKQVNHWVKANESQSSSILNIPQFPGTSLLKAGPAISASKGISTSKPFKALVPAASKNITNSGNQPLSTNADHLMDNRILIPSISADLDFSQEKDVELGPITLAPSILQRKRVPNLALILSGISIRDLSACAQVSRLFRYSAYLSAAYQLTRRFPGSRLEGILTRFSPKTTNLWPYLCQRENEILDRKRIYEQSFLGHALKGLCYIAEDLWSSPDNEKQATIAVRFLLTKLFFLVSVGYSNNRMDLLKGTIMDAQEVVLNEIWRITFCSIHSTDTFFVLEATCEVIGQPSTARLVAPNQPRLREDWLAYVAVRRQDESRAKSKQSILTLTEHLRWTNHEEYSTGISKLWLSKLKAEGETGLMKLMVAWRYVLACVVSNSVSGRWLTSNEMAQDFHGLPTSLPPSEHTRQRLNLFLPAYHHVESLHFTSAHGQVLHSALAVVQTPGREFYILKDNGMQVGCGEEGVACVWMELLGCTRDGCAQ